MADFSQNGESKIIAELLGYLQITRPRFIEIGAGDGYHLSNTRYFKDMGFDVRMIDADNKGNTEVEQIFVTLKNIGDIAHQSLNVNVLSIDIDGNDYWILDEYLTHDQPEIICLEINSQLPLDKSITMPYNENHQWDGSFFYGMSYLAAFKLLDRHKYQLYKIVNATNIIAVRPKNPVVKIFAPPYTLVSTWSHPEKGKTIKDFKLI